MSEGYFAPLLPAYLSAWVNAAKCPLEHAPALRACWPQPGILTGIACTSHGARAIATETDIPASFGPNASPAASFAARYARWNFTVLSFEAAAFWSGLAFFDSATVLPVLLARLHASDLLVGLSRVVQTLGYTLPALFASHYIHGRAHHKPFLLTMCALSRAGVLALPPLFLYVAPRRPALTLALLFLVYAVFWTLDGACGVSWFDIIAKTILPRVRGRFFGVMQTVGGIAAVGAGFAVKYVFQHYPYPTNFAILAVGWCAGLATSQLLLTVIREPDGRALEGVVEEDAAKLPLGAYLRQAMPLLRRNRKLARLIATRLLLDGAGMAAPFYVLFARRGLHADLKMVGVYAIVLSAGKVCAGPLWGWVSDRSGPVVGLRAVAAAVLAIPALALASALGGAWAFPAVFFLLGAVQDGAWMVASNAMLDALDARDRSLGVGVSSVFQTPGALYGILGGALAGALGYPVLFAVALAFAAIGLVMCLRLDTRRRMTVDG